MPILHHHPEHREHKVEIGTGTNCQPFISLRCGLRATRVQCNHLGTTFAPRRKTHHTAGRDRTNRCIISDKQDVLGVIVIGQYFVVDIKVTGHHIGAQVPGGHTMLHRRSDDIRYLIRHCKRYRPAHIKHTGGPATDHRPFVRLDLGFLLFGLDILPGLFPACLAERPGATLRAFNPDQWGLDAIRVIGLAQAGLATGADLAAIQGGIRVTVKLDDTFDTIARTAGHTQVTQ